MPASKAHERLSGRDLPPIDETARKCNPFTLREGAEDEEDAVYGRADHRVLREHGAGGKVEELCRRHGISTTLYKWKARYGEMTVPEAKRLRSLEDENRRLKHLLAEAMLDNQALKGLLSKK
jgi:putative transposase